MLKYEDFKRLKCLSSKWERDEVVTALSTREQNKRRSLTLTGDEAEIGNIMPLSWKECVKMPY